MFLLGLHLMIHKLDFIGWTVYWYCWCSQQHCNENECIFLMTAVFSLEELKEPNLGSSIVCLRFVYELKV